jgi:hypothetical protein
MKRTASLLALMILCSMLAFTVKPTRITVSISPAKATLYSATTKQFTATVSGTSNSAVTWSADLDPDGPVAVLGFDKYWFAAIIYRDRL